MRYYILSHDSTIVIDNERLQVYRWVPVGPSQIKSGADFKLVPPNDRPGEIVRYRIEDRGEVFLRVMGDSKLREVTSKERESGVTKFQGPRI